MLIIHEICCGLDVHKDNITACMLTKKGKDIKTFGTMTDDIFELIDWLKSSNCPIVAMESTSVYWKPIFNLLEAEEIETLVVNAKHIKAVPGRKTDVKDAEWIANLLKHGLINGSFIPDRDQRELRELVRYRRSLIQERSRELNRLQKILEGANIKLSSVASDIMGVSSRAMLEELIKSDQQLSESVIAKLVKGKMKSKLSELQRALNGVIGHHQKMILSTQLDHIDFLSNKIESLNKEVEERISPFNSCLEILDDIPGVGRITIQELAAEIGTDMGRFPTAEHLCSWAGMAPGNNESAGKRKSGKTNKGNKHLRTTLIEAARAAAKTKDTYLSNQYHRIAARRGDNKAAVAVGHSILVIVYHMLKYHKPFVELGADYLDKTKKDAVLKNYLRKIEKLGYEVDIREKTA